VNSVLEQMMAPVVTVGIRLGTLMSFAPFFGSKAISARVKAGLTIVLTALVYPLCAPRMAAGNPVEFAQIVFGEAVIGLALAMCIQFVFEGVRLAGQLLGFQIGFSLVNAIDPQTNVDTPVLSTLHETVILLVFFRLSVDHWMLRALVKSFEYAPPGSITVSSAAMRHLAAMAVKMFCIGAEIAVPVLAATLLIDLVLGLIAKVAPQVPVLFLGMSIKSLVGMGVLLGAVGYWPKLFERYFEGAFRATERLITLMH
jgi:flagellar biosynthetic protein FliR